MRKTTAPYSAGTVCYLLEGPGGLLLAGLHVDHLPAETAAELRQLQGREQVGAAWAQHGAWLLEEARRLQIAPAFKGRTEYFAQSLAPRVRR